MFVSNTNPLPDGDQVVIVRHYDRLANEPESRVVADFLRWRGGTGTLGDLAAGRRLARNVRMGDGIVEPISIAEVTAFSRTSGVNFEYASATGPPAKKAPSISCALSHVSVTSIRWS